MVHENAAVVEWASNVIKQDEIDRMIGRQSGAKRGKIERFAEPGAGQGRRDGRA